MRPAYRQLRTQLPPRLRILTRSATSGHHVHYPNEPLELDPSFRELLRDVEISLRNKLPSQDATAQPAQRELEVYPNDPDATEKYMTSEELDSQDDAFEARRQRKSPAASFGSQRIGSVVLPHELQSTIQRMVEESDKPTLHQDAKRLFLDGNGLKAGWHAAYDTRYKSGQEAGRFALRDGTAFATVALPLHYSAIYAVLDHAKRRLGPQWELKRVIDWGAATGSGLWASGHTFQRHERAGADMEDIQISRSALSSYLGIDKREGLVRIGKRLLRDVETGGLQVTWQKSLHDEDVMERSGGSNVLALSAFLLSSLTNPIDRKALVKEMWRSGAEVMILIDHNFEHVAEAREQLLKMGRRELEDPAAEAWPVKGSHVVAPCPHDGTCPLYHSGSKLECGFSQRMQRPEFVRKTKHSGSGHEDIGYSYVVVRRGTRPSSTSQKVGRVGEVGLRDLAKEAQVRATQTEHFVDGALPSSPADGAPEDPAMYPGANELVSPEDPDSDALEEDLRQEAYSWPRLVFRPLKRSGHIILDACTAQAQILRMTIPKSQGKQPFYDARKSEWGDIFPHAPKNQPQVRYPFNREDGGPGSNIGKRKASDKRKSKSSYAHLAENIHEQRRDQRRARMLAQQRSEL